MMGRMINDLVVLLPEVVHLGMIGLLMIGLWMMGRMTNGLVVPRLEMIGLVMVA